MELNVKTKSGYFITDRSVELKVANGRYFANEILDNLKKLKKENLTLLINQLKELDIDWDTFLSGTTFSGNLITNNYYFVDKPKLQLNLSSLSHQLMYEINSNKDASKILLPIFDRKILGFKFDLDFNANIEKVQLKDIDETIIDKNDRLVFQLIDNTYDKQNLSVGKLYFNFKNSDENLVLQFDRINSMFAQNNNLKFNIKDISLRTDKFTFTAKNLDSGHDYKSFNNKLEFNENFSLENIQINSKELPISLEKASYALKLSDLDEIQLNTLAQDYRNSMGDINNYTEYEIGNFFKFINEGLKLKIDINVQNLKVDKIKSGQYTFNTNLKITKNDLNQYNISLDKVLNTLESIDGGEYTFLDLYIDEDSGKSIIESGKEFKNIFEKLGFLKDKKYSFQFWRKNGKIVFNNLELGSVAEILGDNHFEKENYSSAINFYKFAVENGDFYANYRLAYSYNKLENFDLAIKYYNNFIDALDTSKLENTKQDKALSMNQIADVYRWGKEDYKNAIIWYLKAIENEYKYPDYFQLAYSYDMLEDYTNAEKWYKKSIENDNEKVAMWNLGLIYEYGKGKIKMNIDKAIKMYRKASQLGYSDATERLEFLENKIKKESEQKQRTIEYEKRIEEDKKIIKQKCTNKGLNWTYINSKILCNANYNYYTRTQCVNYGGKVDWDFTLDKPFCNIDDTAYSIK